MSCPIKRLSPAEKQWNDHVSADVRPRSRGNGFFLAVLAEKGLTLGRRHLNGHGGSRPSYDSF